MKRRRALLLSLTLVLVLSAACGWWLHIQQRQYARNRQLIDTLEHGDTKTALALINDGADPNTRQNATPTTVFELLLNPLMHRKGSSAVYSPTAFMLACGASWKPTTDPQLLPITVNENLPLLQAMLAHGANIHDRAKNGVTALHFAATDERLHTVELLLQHGADVNVQHKWGRTPLMSAALYSPPTVLRLKLSDGADMVHLLLSRGAKPNIQDTSGYTALHYAIRSPCAKVIISDLLAHGADPTLRNNKGDTPVQLAQKIGHPDVVRLLKGSVH